MSKMSVNAVELLGSANELHILKGQLLKPELKQNKKEETYYSFQLKTITRQSEDAYNNMFNMYNIIVPSQVAVEIPQEELASMKGHEVICVVRMSNTVKKTATNVFNNANYYLESFKLSKTIERNESQKASVAL